MTAAFVWESTRSVRNPAGGEVPYGTFAGEDAAYFGGNR
jgi:hypothetical protein